MNIPIKRFASSLLIGLCLAVSIPSANAATLSFIPAQQTVNTNTVTVDLFVSGLGPSMSPSLGIYDLDIGFDSAILEFTGAVYGDPAGDQLDFSGFADKQTTPGNGSVNLYELSFDTVAELNSLQAGSFVLATLTFNTLSAGTSPLAITINAFGDAEGIDLPVSIQNGSVTVPEPSSLALLVCGGLLLLFSVDKHTGRSRIA